MFNNLSPHSKGLLLTAFGGLVLSIDIPLIRLADGDHWSILLVRSTVTASVSLMAWLVWRMLSRKAPPLIPGRSGLIVTALYGVSAICFMTAVFNTPTANLVFILTFNSMFAALLSWLFLKERLQRATLLAMLMMLVGVLIIVGDGIGSGHLFGDMMAVLASFLLASAITVSRGSGKDMGFASLVALVLPAGVALAMTAESGISIDAPLWILLNGAVVMPIAFFCLATGPKYLSGPEVAMFYLLETVLAPIWVWMIFAEAPSRATLVGGVLLITTLIAHSAWQVYAGRKQRRSRGNVRRPI